jgi:hypothetical protein
VANLDEAHAIIDSMYTELATAGDAAKLGHLPAS